MSELASQTPLTQGVYPRLTGQPAHPDLFIYQGINIDEIVIYTPQRIWLAQCSGRYSIMLNKKLYYDRYSYSHITCWSDGHIYLTYYLTVDIHKKLNINTPALYVNVRKRLYIDKPTIYVNGNRHILTWYAEQRISVCYTPSGITIMTFPYLNYDTYAITSVTFDGKHLSIHYKHRKRGTAYIKLECVTGVHISDP